MNIYDKINYASPDKPILDITITGNDDTVHLESLEKVFKDAFSKFLKKRDVKKLVKYIIKEMKENENLRTSHWDFNIPLKGPQISGLHINVYPTWDSWQHIRDERNIDVT